MAARVAAAIEQLELLGDQRFLAIYESLAQNGFGPLDAEVARSLNFRPQAVGKLPMAQRAKRARALMLSSRHAELAYEVLGAYLMKHRRALVTGFLDATGVPHEDGMIQDLDGARPDPAKVAAAIAAADAAHPPEDVTIYLGLCRQNWPGASEIEAAWRARTGGAVAG